jgi:hypothetical protein
MLTPSDKIKEKHLWQWVKTQYKNAPSGAFIERVENSVGSGFPDVAGMYNGVPVMLELKTAGTPVRKTTGINIRSASLPGEIEWHKKYREAGGLSYMLLQVGKRRFLIYSEHMHLFDNLQSPTISEIEGSHYAREIKTLSEILNVVEKRFNTELALQGSPINGIKKIY